MCGCGQQVPIFQGYISHYASENAWLCKAAVFGKRPTGYLFCTAMNKGRRVTIRAIHLHQRLYQLIKCVGGKRISINYLIVN